MSFKKAIFLFLGLLIFFSCSSVNKGFDKIKYTKLSTISVVYPNQKVKGQPKINTVSIIEKRSFIQTNVNLSIDTVTKKTKELEQPLFKEKINIISNQKINKNFNNLKKIKNNKSKQKNKSKPKEYSLLLLVLLSFLLPFLAVGLKTNWDLVKVIIALILWPFIIIAIIYSLLIVYDILEF